MRICLMIRRTARKGTQILCQSPWRAMLGPTGLASGVVSER
jgi:hypothetical protein